MCVLLQYIAVTRSLTLSVQYMSMHTPAADNQEQL